jgi:hypothetical protein
MVDSAVSPQSGYGERVSGPFVDEAIRACVPILGNNLHYFNPPRSKNGGLV